MLTLILEQRRRIFNQREAALSDLPTGTVTFLFTDIQGSTRLWQNHPRAMKKALARHDVLLREAIEANRGWVFKTVGDAFCAAFDTALDAVQAALAAQLALQAETWELPAPILIRAALHTGEAEERNQDYYGPALNRAARLLSLCHGRQTLLSLVTTELVRDTLPPGVSLKELGEHRLKDLTRPESVYQLLHAELPADFPPLHSLDAHPHNLPIQPTPMIGREKELAQVEKLLQEDSVRILTLTGPGGMGKTRLALQAAADVIERFKHGTFFVDLSSVSDPSLVAGLIAAVLHLQETGKRPLLEILKDCLCDKQMLLVLDNFEQILDAALQVVTLASACPQIRFLVTSREALHVRGERAFPVPPLSLPAVGDRAATPIKAITQYDAVRLFIERALAVRPDFQVTNESAPAVAGICARLDGIPLAIELAAARIKMLTPQAILDRLANRLRLLTGGARDLPLRQRTLRATIEWSYDLLSPECQKLFQALCVFCGGFTLEAAETIGCRFWQPQADILDGLESLLDKSLLSQENSPSRVPRFSILETIREYGLERLEDSREAGAARGLHAECYLNMAQAADSNLGGSIEPAELDRLQLEHNNLRAALRWFGQELQKESELRLAGSLWGFWLIRGHLSEGRQWLDKALSQVQDRSRSSVARALLGAGNLSRAQGDYSESIRHLEESLEIFRTIQDETGVLTANIELGWTCYRADRLAEAHKFFTLAREMALQQGGELSYGIAELGLGLWHWREGRLPEALLSFEDSLRIFQRKGEKWREAQAMCNLGIIHYQMGKLEEASLVFWKAKAILESMGDSAALPVVCNNLGSLFHKMGKYRESICSYEQLLRTGSDIGDRRATSTALAGLSEVYLAMGEPEKALDQAERACEEAQRLESGIELGVSLRVLGDAWLAKGNAAKAIALYERSIPIMQSLKEEEEMAKVLSSHRRAAAMLAKE